MNYTRHGESCESWFCCTFCWDVKVNFKIFIQTCQRAIETLQYGLVYGNWIFYSMSIRSEKCPVYVAMSAVARNRGTGWCAEKINFVCRVNIKTNSTNRTLWSWTPKIGIRNIGKNSTAVKALEEIRYWTWAIFYTQFSSFFQEETVQKSLLFKYNLL